MIRKAQLKDIKALVKLRMALIREANHIQEDEDISEIEKNIVSYLEENLDGEFLVWVIEEDGEIVATSGLNLFQKPPTYANPTGQEAFIMNIYVTPASRRKGYAACLIHEIIRYLKTTGCNKINLVATEAGKYVYEKIGFKAKDGVMEYTL
ncbi:GNAT family N-acetyltransferase [Cellulosilyticum sp. I15G10I2]|uniref:GNAT family N-acetyltransferase n=1 Tax=Cellulosilyticum sp. I15G10I2 TaxID=1892843 RepID=UPI00085BD75E|nr:GNAT family N-acetyltransferase [Cellulosilyticum sp. I15G10I2]